MAGKDTIADPLLPVAGVFRFSGAEAAAQDIAGQSVASRVH